MCHVKSLTDAPTVWVHRHSCTCDLQIMKPIHFFNSNCDNTVVSCVGVDVLIFHYRNQAVAFAHRDQFILNLQGPRCE